MDMFQAVDTIFLLVFAILGGLLALGTSIAIIRTRSELEERATVTKKLSTPFAILTLLIAITSLVMAVVKIFLAP